MLFFGLYVSSGVFEHGNRGENGEFVRWGWKKKEDSG